MNRQRYRGAQVNKETLFELADAMGLDEEALRKRNYTTPQLVDLLVAQGQILVRSVRKLEDIEDNAVIEARANEPTIPWEDVKNRLKL